MADEGEIEDLADRAARARAAARALRDQALAVRRSTARRRRGRAEPRPGADGPAG